MGRPGPVRHGGGTRWLDDAEQRTWRALLAVAAALPGRLDADLRTVGLSHAEYVVLAMLSEAPDRTLRMAELARQANVSPSRLSHTVGRLASRGLLTRAPVPGDRRGTTAALSEAGWSVVVDAAPTHVATVRHLLFDRIDADELAVLERVTTRITATLAVEPDLPADRQVSVSRVSQSAPSARLPVRDRRTAADPTTSAATSDSHLASSGKPLADSAAKTVMSVTRAATRPTPTRSARGADPGPPSQGRDSTTTTTATTAATASASRRPPTGRR